MTASVARRDRIVAFIRAYHKQHGFSPTMREIAAGCGLRSFSAAHRQVQLLVDEGRLAADRGIPRSVRVVEQP